MGVKLAKVRREPLASDAGAPYAEMDASEYDGSDSLVATPCSSSSGLRLSGGYDGEGEVVRDRERDRKGDVVEMGAGKREGVSWEGKAISPPDANAGRKKSTPRGRLRERAGDRSTSDVDPKRDATPRPTRRIASTAEYEEGDGG